MPGVKKGVVLWLVLALVVLAAGTGAYFLFFQGSGSALPASACDIPLASLESVVGYQLVEVGRDDPEDLPGVTRCGYSGDYDFTIDLVTEAVLGQLMTDQLSDCPPIAGSNSVSVFFDCLASDAANESFSFRRTGDAFAASDYGQLLAGSDAAMVVISYDSSYFLPDDYQDVLKRLSALVYGWA